MLLLHVFNFHGEQLAVLKSGLQCIAGVLCMHVGLDDLVVVHHHHAVADGLQEQAQLQGVLLDLRVTAHDKLGAVGKVDLAVEFRGHVPEEFRGLLGLFLFGEAAFQHDAAAEHAEHSLENEAQPLAAGVHNPSLFQHRQQVGGVLQSVCGAHAGGVPHLNGIAAQLQGFTAPFGSDSGHGEDSAFRGLHYSLVGLVHAQLQRGHQVFGGDLLLALQALGDAPEQQGQNDAGVAPGAPQHGGSRLFRCLGSVGRVVQLLHFLRRGANGHGHVGAGVAVGHGENVQLVHLLFILGNIVGTGDDRVFQLRT